MCHKNAKGYRDLPAGEAMANVAREEKAAKRNQPTIVYIASAYRGDIPTNTERAIKYSRFVASKTCVPFTPHLLFTRFLNDSIPDERRQGLSFGTAMLAKCDALWAFGDISEGMRAEIETAKRLGKHIKYFNAKCEEVSAI